MGIMKLHFDPNQPYQLDAIRAITDVFEGQKLSSSDFEISLSTAGCVFSENGFGNKLNIGTEQILQNVRVVQERNKIKDVGSELHGMNFSVEMETGTGKTYVYLRTIYELNRLYGFCKFVIVVPSVAIREGVLKNLQITHEHFQSRYENICLSFGVYDSKKVSSLRNFATSNAIQILVMNIDAFAKDDNIINKPNDKLNGKTPMEFIQATHPIVIVDEPQNMETENRKIAIQRLNPLCTLRYSATHTNLYNLAYSLNPLRAYDLGLVKQIEVYSAVGENAMNDAFIKVESIKHSGKSKIVAKVWLDVNTKNGVQRKEVTVGGHDYDLFRLSGEREIYRDLYVEGIDILAKNITLSNGQTMSVGEARGGLSEEIQREMIRMAVEEHLKKEKLYADRGIKVLTLFFIDRVRNYRDYDGAGNAINGKFAQWFEKAYNEEINKPKYAAIKRFAAKDVHDGYFSQDKGKLKDTGGETQADDDTYKLIMQDKERLLSMETPLRFIFSHSALREGWDNPNVFQICTLNETRSDLKKRQEIGRGLRLCVDSDGNRVHGKDVNRLTVIANESYEDFAKALQEEIRDDCGVNFIGRIKDRRERVKVDYRKGFEIDEKFLEIWERIRHKTKYRVSYDTSDLIREAGKAVGEMPAVYHSSIRRTLTTVVMTEEAGVSSDSMAERAPVECVGEDSTVFDIPDVVSYIQGQTGLTRQTVFDIIRESGRTANILVNPQMFMDSAVGAIKKALHELMIDGIRYEKIGEKIYEMTLFDDSGLEIYLDNPSNYEVKNADKTIYENYMPLDSSVESEFAKACEKSDTVKFYFKLPGWFKISTPIGTYNPDWAVVFEDDKKVYFVAETKGKDAELPGSQELRIKCGTAYVQAFGVGEGEVQYHRVATLKDLADKVR